MRDGGRPSGGGLQDQPSNYPALLGDKIPGGERTGKRREELVRYVAGRRTKVNRKCSVESHSTVIKTRPIWQPGIKSSRNLFTGWTVTGIQE